jgi:D-proline reductase (dithiol) PrdB
LPEPTQPIQYIQRTAEYYSGLGYDKPYQWASYSDIPFTPLPKALKNCRLGIVTTAALYQPELGNQDPWAPYNSAAKFYRVYSYPTDEPPDLRISHIAIDRDHTSAEDLGSYFPLKALRTTLQHNRIGEIASEFFGLPTNRSIRTTLEVDCPDLVSRCLKADIDAVILVPNCPVCHQSVSLAARSLEVAGVSTVITGCALDIVENVGVPRFLFSDFPLGNSAGKPNDTDSQYKVLSMALSLLEEAKSPGTTGCSGIEWNDDDDWKKDYSNIHNLTDLQIETRKKEFEQGKQIAQSLIDQK